MKLPRGRRLIIVLAVPVGLAAAGALAFMTMSGGPSVPPTVPNPAAGEHGPMLALDSRVINLQPSAASTYRYAKIAVTVELRPGDAGFYAQTGEARSKAETTEIAKHEESVPLLLDALGQIVSSHDAASLTGADGRTKLKDELLVAMRKVLGAEDVLDIYFTDLVMQ